MSDGRLPARRRWLRWSIAIVVTLLVLAIGWVSVRGIGAVNELQQVARTSSQVKQAISEGDVDRASVLSQRIAQHAENAHELTADPIWHGFGIIPWLGPNFTAVADIAEIADDVTTQALLPVIDAADTLDLASLGLSGGRVDLTPFVQIEPSLAVASEVLRTADHRASRIDADATLPPLADAVREMSATVSQASTVVGALHGASTLLPTMLGADGPRDYVIAMQNNAEVRSSGGIVGAVALVHAENGAISLTQQASTADFPPLDVALPLEDSTIALFEDRPGRFLQNITSIPDFTQAGPLIAARWEQRFGTPVDGVIAVDAVMMQYLLEATGPIAFGPFTADADNVVDLLLSEIYAAVPDPAAQDEIFAQAAGALFSAALTAAEPRELIGALAESADERRVRVWSSHADEQEFLATTQLSGALPTDTDESHVGVLFNDATGAKMDFYMDAAVTTAVGQCDGVPTTQVSITWTNNAPADAATSLPDYVTGAGWGGIPPGQVRTLVAVYGPEGATIARVDTDGSTDAQTALLGARSTVQHTVQLAPGESTTITVDFQGTGAGDQRTIIDGTPLIREVDTSRAELRCGS